MAVAAGGCVAAGIASVGAGVAAVPQAERTVAATTSTATRLYQYFFDMVFFSFS
jgi:hypothetical protein